MIRPYADFPDKNEWFAAALGLAPFVCTLTTTVSTSTNGRITSFQQTDYVAIVLGALCVLTILSTARLWPRTRPEDRIKRLLVFAVLIVLGIYQVARGFGLFSSV